MIEGCGLSLLRLIDAFTFEIDAVGKRVVAELGRHTGYQAIQAIPGVGAGTRRVFVAEIGDVTRFPGPAKLCSWAGLTPKHRESDTKVHRGRITKHGNKLVRWAAVLPDRGRISSCPFAGRRNERQPVPIRPRCHDRHA